MSQHKTMCHLWVGVFFLLSLAYHLFLSIVFLVSSVQGQLVLKTFRQYSNLTINDEFLLSLVTLLRMIKGYLWVKSIKYTKTLHFRQVFHSHYIHTIHIVPLLSRHNLRSNLKKQFGQNHEHYQP